MVKDGMIVGLGTGRAASTAITALGGRIRTEGLKVTGIPTSRASHALGLELGIPLVEPGSLARLDITLDGADEVDPSLNVIKGGGGALVREKLLASASDCVVLMIEEPKEVERLGRFPLPIAVIPFAWRNTASRIEAACGKPTTLRQAGGAPYVTDDGLYILDVAAGLIDDPADFGEHLKHIVGVVEVGLFLGLCHRLIIGHPDGTATVRVKDSDGGSPGELNAVSGSRESW